MQDLAPETRPPGRHVFSALDGLRGVAAVGVVLWHGTTDAMRPPSGYLAVDLFFMLSGFVLAYSYGDRLRSLRDLGPYALRRLIRLYPLHLVGLALGFAVYLWDVLPRGAFWPTSAAVSLGLGGLFLPAPASISTDPLYAMPLNPPGWSLAWEVGVSLLFGLTARLLTPRVLAVLLAVAAAAAIGLLAYRGDFDGGSSFPDFYAGGVRVAWGFFCGVGLYRLYKAGRLPRERAWLGVLLLVVVLFAPLTDAIRPWVQAGFLFVVLPLAVGLSTGTRRRPVLAFLGRISYALYIVHWPIGILLNHYAPAAGALGLLAISLAVAALLEPLDTRLRAWLTRQASPSAGALS